MKPARRLEPSRIASSIGSSAVFGIASIAVNILLLPVVLSNIGAGQYGTWLILTTLATYIYYADLGIGSALIYHLSRARATGDAMRQRVVLSSGLAWIATMGFLGCGVFFAITTWSGLMSGTESAVADDSREILNFLAASLLACLGLRAFNAALQGMGHWVQERTNQLVGIGLRAIGTVAVCWLHPTIVSIAVVETLAFLTPGILSAMRVCTRTSLRPSLKCVRWSMLTSMLSYGGRSFAVGMTWAVILQAGTLIVGHQLGPASAAFYNAILRVYQGARQVFTWITDPFLSALSQLYEQNPRRATDVFIAVSQMATLLGGLIPIALCFASPAIMGVWLGASDVPQPFTTGLVVLLLGLSLNSTHVSAIPASSAAGRPGSLLPHQIVWALLSIAISVVLVRPLGVVGVALGLTMPLLALQPFYLLTIRTRLGVGIRAAWTGFMWRPFAALSSSSTVVLVLLFSGSIPWRGIDSMYLAGIYAILYVGCCVVLLQGEEAKRLRSVLSGRI